MQERLKLAMNLFCYTWIQTGCQTISRASFMRIFNPESTNQHQRMWYRDDMEDRGYKKRQLYLALDGEKEDSAFILRSPMEIPVPITSDQWL